MSEEYSILNKDDFTDNDRRIFGDLLKLQNKVNGDPYQKLDRCKIACIVRNDATPIAIGAIKEKTSSDFSDKKADLLSLSSHFNWELGYFFTKNDYSGQGIASKITSMLIKAHGDDNLMASTEITANPGMVKILEKNGFRLFGKPWQSRRPHNHLLGLFLKFR